jgi:DNA-binding LacI/PurR family transcriptional regulator
MLSLLASALRMAKLLTVRNPAGRPPLKGCPPLPLFLLRDLNPPNSMAIKSVRDLARSLGISHTTVSDALRNSPRVRLETRERVLAAADEAGYRYNPLAGALMSEMRRSGVGTFRGVLAVVDLECEEARDQHTRAYHRAIVKGAKEAAERLGFKAEPFVLGRAQMSVTRLGSILHSRGIRGILILPAGVTPDIEDLDWDHFAGIYTDYIIERPALDSVCSDHFRSMYVALHHLQQLGYRRPGLALHESQDSRLLYRWEAAFRMYHSHHGGFDSAEPLMLSELSHDAFAEWFRAAEPDVVLSHRAVVLDWMRDLGAVVPETHGFCCLNVAFSPFPSGGLDLQPGLIGARGTKALIAQLHRNEYGIPATSSTITIPAVWRDGPTLRTVRKVHRLVDLAAT